MRPDYVRPGDLKEIAKYKSSGGTLFSGGTDVFVKMRGGLLRPKILVDTKGVETPKIECTDTEMTIYMNATYTDLLKSECLDSFPLLKNLVLEVGSTQIRNRGTPIGNIGNASPAGDFLLASYLYGATAVVAPSMRKIGISDLVSGPGKVDLDPEEFLYSVSFPILKGYDWYYEKVGRRNALVISIASLDMMVKLKGDEVEDLKIAYGSVGPTVVRFEDLESEFKGANFDLKTFSTLAVEYMNRVKPITDVRASAEYRRLLVRNLLLKGFLSIEKSNKT